jgi:hypothetical protein
MQNNLGGALQYRKSYSNRSCLGHNLHAWFAAVKRLCYSHLLKFAEIVVRKRTGIHESGQPMGDPEWMSSGYFLGGGPLGGSWVKSPFGR